MKKLTGLVEEQIRYSRKKNSELEGIVIKTIQTKAQKEKDWGKYAILIIIKRKLELLLISISRYDLIPKQISEENNLQEMPFN